MVTFSTSATTPSPDEVLIPGESFKPVAEPEAGVLTLLGEIWQGCWQGDSWTIASILRLAWVFPLVALCSWLGIVLSHQSEGVATIWLSNGMIFGLLITQPKRRWLAYFIAGLTADTLADMVYGDSFRIAIGVSLANSIEVITSTLLLTLWFDWPLDLSKRKSLVGFLMVSVLGATALTSALGAWWTLLMVPGPAWWQMFRTWYLGDMLGMAVLAPLVIMVQRPAFFSMFDRRHLSHTLLVLSTTVVVAALVFTHSQDPLIFFMFPAFLLVAFRLGLPGTVVNILLVTLMAIGFTVKGHGPLMLISGEHMLLHRVVIAQIFAAVGIFTMFPVAALLEEKEALKNSLAASEERFRNLAHIDELTGLPNRRAFNLRFESAWVDAFASGEPLAVVIVDADRFKQYNDVVGHLGGDACLRSIAQTIAGIVEETAGTAARIGGEEFAAILPGTTPEQARNIAEKIRVSVIGLALQHPFSPCGVQTVSLGVAALVPQSDQSSINLMRLADEALYVAKSAGRNQVACS
ncbi:diguanylate cyclase (GGDEF)-like protein [Silvibacterium bohemicum]|uniref:diguanylate cyclase n=1 Tax=Silvibacterium bohemicum TaxID=1577686 RepID=A0A841JTN0_9BACT|nr:sensor domain-containing diguanylate cyclase [Silvibacterium bohemicum]MBB6144763.1 diguanylate cyclase (GGDEF)-like protein [Silvibacterium bohemicum]